MDDAVPSSFSGDGRQTGSCGKERIMPEENVNIHVRPPELESKTEVLTCNWCRLPHPVEPGYKSEVLARGAERIEEARKANALADADIKPEETWTCGRCMIHLMGLPETMRTECHDHEVPKRT